MRPEAAPWANAEVHGKARDVRGVLACIARPMELSGGGSEDEPALEELWRARGEEGGVGRRGVESGSRKGASQGARRSQPQTGVLSQMVTVAVPA